MTIKYEKKTVDFEVTDDMVSDLNQEISDLEPHQKRAFMGYESETGTSVVLNQSNKDELREAVSDDE